MGQADMTTRRRGATSRPPKSRSDLQNELMGAVLRTGLTDEQAADRAGIHASTVAAWRRGDHLMNLAYAERMAEAIGYRWMLVLK